ncbi:hypothetical protein [Solidesulfovibrio sp.]
METQLNVTKRLFILLNLMSDGTTFFATEIADILGIDMEDAEKEIDFFADYLVNKVSRDGEVPTYEALKRG